MTREEAINQLKQICIGGTHEDDTPCAEYLRKCYEAIDMAISALSEQKSPKERMEHLYLEESLKEDLENLIKENERLRNALSENKESEK